MMSDLAWPTAAELDANPALWDRWWWVNGAPDYGLGAGFGHVDWVIAGGESGPGARPMHPDWARDLRDQCAAGGVPFLFKQWGEWAEYDTDHREPDGSHRLIEVGPRGSALPASWQPGVSALISNAGHVVKHHDGMRDGVAYRHIVRVGKHAAGRTLDGVIHDGYPGQVSGG